MECCFKKDKNAYLEYYYQRGNITIVIKFNIKRLFKKE